jgi:thioredoxin-like negative regulator of GroEL
LNPYDGFRAVKPDAVIQRGVYVYTGRFSVPLAAALVEAHEAQKLAGDGRLKEALEKASDALQLAPGSARVQAALGDVLAAAGEPAEALSHYSTALQAAEAVRPDLQAGFAASLKTKIEKLNGLQAQ